MHWLPINYTSVFKYETYTRFRSIRLAAPSQSSLQLKAELLITRLNTCQYELRLRNVNSSIWTADQTTALTSLPIRFGLSFGRVQQVCASDTDPDWSLNIKRALVSNLQLYWPPPDIRSNRTGIVRLVHGECPFEYQLLTSDATTRRVRLQVPLNNATIDWQPLDRSKFTDNPVTFDFEVVFWHKTTI